MEVKIARVSTRLSEAARELSEAFGNDPTGHDTLVAILSISKSTGATAYFDMDGMHRSKEYVPERPTTLREELATSYSTLDWRPGDPVSVVVENDDGEVIFEQDVSEQMKVSFDEAESDFTHKHGSTEERLDDLHERVSELEE